MLDSSKTKATKAIRPAVVLATTITALVSFTAGLSTAFFGATPATKLAWLAVAASFIVSAAIVRIYYGGRSKIIKIERPHSNGRIIEIEPPY